MADDDDLERVLQRYRPVGPEAALRARVLHQSRPRYLALWLSAAAVLLLAVSLHVLASRTHDDIARRLDVTGAAEETALVGIIVADVADGDLAREMVRRLIFDRERHRAVRPAGVEESWTP